MKYTVMILTLLALVLTGCGGTKPTGAFEDIAYSYTGGIAGFDQRLTIGSDGTFQIADKGKTGAKGKLSASELSAVADLAGKVQWAGLQERYVDPRVADATFEEVTVIIEDKTYKTVVGTGGGAPAELTQLLAKLQQVLNANK